jgi:RNA polymerase sigma-70 factor (ECF subfamily)
MFEAGQAAWPGVAIDAREMAVFLGERSTSSGLARLHAADLFLACACAKGVPAALAAFERTLMSQVPSFLSETRASPGGVDEVAQSLRERLLVSTAGRPAQIGTYSGRGTLASWLRVAALRTASNLRRHDRAEAAAAGTSDDASPADPELAFLKARYRPAFEAALADALSGLDTEERMLLRLHFLDGMSIDRLGMMFGVHRATAARRLASAREALLRTTKGLVPIGCESATRSWRV